MPELKIEMPELKTEINIVLLLRCYDEEMPDNNEYFQKFLDDVREDILKDYKGSWINVFMPDMFKDPKSKDYEYFHSFAGYGCVDVNGTTFHPNLYSINNINIKIKNTVKNNYGACFREAKNEVENIDEVVILSLNRNKITKEQIDVFTSYYKFPKEKITVYKYNQIQLD